MSRPTRFRLLLPLAQTVLATLFGGVGLWQRDQILSQHIFSNDQTLWQSTAAFHVWPWPYKFAVISNMPAHLLGLLASWPIAALWPSLPEAAQLAPSLVFVAMLWYWVGHRLDRRWRSVGTAGVLSSTKTPWILLLVFTAVCLLGAFLPIGAFTPVEYVGYLPYGIVVWLVTAATILRTTKPPSSAIVASARTR